MSDIDRSEAGKPSAASDWTHHTVSQVWSRPGGNVATNASKDVSQAPTTGDRTSSQQQWTVVVDLAINQHEKVDGKNVKYNAEHDMERLRRLSALPGVTIVAQELLPSGGNLHHKIERYEISAGHVKHLSSSQSEGTARDLQALLRFAAGEHPSHKMGLVITAHGFGDQGIRGDSDVDTTKLPDLRHAIETGMGGKKLNLLDLDSCTMATESVLYSLKDVANNVVASAELEPNLPDGGDAQNLYNSLMHLQDPKLTGSQWADAIVNDSKHGRNQERAPAGFCTPPDLNGTLTEAHFDLRNETALHNNLDRLGSDLSELANDPANKAVLRSIVDSSLFYGSPMVRDGTAGTDLKEVLSGIKHAIENNKLKFDDPAKRSGLIDDLDAANSARERVVASYWGQTNKNPCHKPLPPTGSDASSILSDRLDYQKAGGLSVFLPGSKFADVHELADQQSFLNAIVQRTDHSHVMSLSAADMKRIKADFAGFQDKLAEGMEGAQPADGAVLQRMLGNAFAGVAGAKTPQSLKDALGALHEAAIKASNSDAGKRIYQQEALWIRNDINSELNRERPYQSAGWFKFVQAMCN